MMENKINKEQFKQFVNSIRDILLYGVNRDNPKEYFCTTYGSFKKCFKMDKTYLYNIIKFMREAGLLTRDSSNIYLELSSFGINIGQDIASGTYWDDAVALCEKRGLYSLDSIIMAVRQLIAKTISEDVSLR